jgi:eukaryotic-like serine/threonine-protein kinase
MNKQARHFYEFGAYRLDVDDRLLKCSDEAVEITPQAFELLLALVENAGHVVSREELSQRLWPNTSVGENSLPQAVAALRRSLHPSGNGYVETVPKRGYRLLPDVRETQELAATPPQEAGAPLSQPAIKVPMIAAGFPRQRIIPIALLLCVTAALLYFFGFRRTHPYPLKANASIPVLSRRPRRTIAVIGINSVSHQSRESWTSTALSEILNVQLGTGEELRVLPQNEVNQAKIDLAIANKAELGWDSVSRIRGVLGADLAVSGSYLVPDHAPKGSLTLDVRVQDAAGDLVATVSESGPSNDLFELASRAGASLRSKLKLQPSSREELASARASWPVRPQAAQFYSQGLEFVHSLKLLEAQDSFEKAIAAEPDFPLSHMRLAEVRSVLGYDDKAKQEAQKAFDLSGKLPPEERLWVEGHYREIANEWDVAIAVYSRLREFYPDEVDYALQLASSEVSAGKRNDGLNVLDRLLSRPLSEGDRARVDLAYAVACGADPPRGLQAAKRARSEGELQNARFLTARATLQESYALDDTGQPQEAMETAVVAQRLFAAIGDRLGYALAVIHRGNLLHHGGTPDQRKALYEEALNVCRQIGNKRCESGALNNLAGVEEDEGDFPEAEKVYEEALRVREEIGTKEGIALAFNNLGTTQEMEGDLKAAGDSYGRAVQQYRAVTFKPGEAMALANLAEVRHFEGSLPEAKRLAEDSVNLSQEIGAQTAFRLGAINTLADILFLQGELDEAEKLYQQSIAMSESLDGRESSAATRVLLASLWIERNRLTDAERELRDCRDTFRRGKDPGHEAGAETWLIQALLRAGKLKDAEQEVPRSIQLTTETSNKTGNLPLTVVLARVQAAEGHITAAEKTLTKSLNWATEHGFAEYALEAKLALGEIERESGSSIGRTHLSEVHREAQTRGFALIAQDASRAMEGTKTRR